MWCSGPNITRVTCLPVCVVVHQGRVSVPTQVTPSKGDTCMLPAAFLCMCGTVHQGRVSVPTQVTYSTVFLLDEVTVLRTRGHMTPYRHTVYRPNTTQYEVPVCVYKVWCGGSR